MIITPRPSLFESSGTNVLGDAAGWITGTLMGSVAVSLCVLAVAFVGLAMLTGRLPVRQGRVWRLAVLYCLAHRLLQMR